MAYIDVEKADLETIHTSHNGYASKADIVDWLNAQPTADVVVHGEWKQGVPYVCSICGKPAPDEKNTSERYSCWTSPYCPHCGAKMDGGKTE